MEIEQAHDIVADLGRRRGGKGGDERAAREPCDERGDLPVARAEVVSPLRETVCLVDGDHRDGLMLEDVLEIARIEPFGCDVDEFVLAAGDGVEARARFFHRKAAVDIGRRDALLRERINLVLHERDERRDHERDAGKYERGNLEADRFARPCRHDRDRIVSREQAAHDGLLRRAERGISVKFPEQEQSLLEI